MDNKKQINEVKFMYNGIKIDGTLKKGTFYREREGSLRNGSVMPEQIRFYMEKYNDHLPKESFEVVNKTDSQRDYFDTDKVIFTLDNKYYPEAFKAWRQAEEKNLKRMITMKEKALPAVPTHKKEEFLKEYENTKEKLKNLLLEEIPTNHQVEVLVNTVPKMGKGENMNTENLETNILPTVIRDYFKQFTDLPEARLPEEQSIAFFAEKVKEGNFLQDELGKIIHGTGSEESRLIAQIQLNKLEYFREESRQVKLSDLEFDKKGYLTFDANINGEKLEGVFRVYDPIEGNNMELIDIAKSIQGNSSVIREEWNDIEKYLTSFSQIHLEELLKSPLAIENNPIVQINYSESPSFEKEERYSLSEANFKFLAENNNFQGQGYDKIEFEIFFKNKEGGIDSYSGRYDIGSESGDLIQHIQYSSEKMLTMGENEKNAYTSINGKEDFQKNIIETHQDIINEVLPMFKENVYQKHLEKVEELANRELSEGSIPTNVGEPHFADQELSNYVSQHPATIKERPTVVINAYGGAGSGKTTSCLGITEELKKAGYVAEYVQEYAKDLVWDENWEKLDGSAAHQFEILKEQVGRMDRLYGKVDFIVTDAPILLNKVYNNELTDAYERSLVKLHNQYNNFNFVVERNQKSFEQEGRMQNLQESIEKDQQIEEMLKKHDLYYGKYNHATTERVVDNAVKTLERVKKQYEKETPNEKEPFQGYAYAKNSDKATVVNGKTEEEILRKLNVWNAARTESNKFATCNIATLNSEASKYDKVRRFDVATGKDITPIYLELPKLEKEEFKQLTEGLKAEGAKYNSFTKQWFITPEQNAENFKKYLPGNETLGEKVESKLEWNNINFSTSKVQYVFNVEYTKQNISENIVIESSRNLDPKELMNALENVLSSRNPERFTQEQLEILNKVKENTIFTEEKKDLLYNPELTPGQMHEIKSALESGLAFEQVKQFALASVEPWQMNFYQYGIEHGVSFGEMEKIVAPKLKQEEEWSHRKNGIDNLVAEKRGLIAKDLEKNGFEVKAPTVKKIERLNFLTHKTNSVKDIATLFRNQDQMQDSQEVKNMVKEIGNELKSQQIMQNKVAAPEI